MRVVSETTVKGWARAHPAAGPGLLAWMEVARLAKWKSLADVRKTYPHADAVSVGSGSTVTVFNIAGNHFRLIAAIHYNRGMVFTLRFLTHAEYDKNRWKAQL